MEPEFNVDFIKTPPASGILHDHVVVSRRQERPCRKRMSCQKI